MSDNEEEKNKENNEENENEESKSEVSPEDMLKYHEFFIKKNKLYVLIIKDENLEDIVQIPIEFKYLNKILNMAEIEMKNETDFIYFTDKEEEVAEGEEKKEIKTINSLKKNLETDFTNNKNENEKNEYETKNNEDNNEIDNKEIINNENENNNENESFGLNFDNNNENEINTNNNNNEIETNKENDNNDNISEEKEEKTPKEENNNKTKDENFINILYPEKRKSFLTYQTKDEYKKLLNTNQYYFVMLPEYSTLDEEEKIPFEIRISKKSFERIFQLNDTNILELISYIEICIIQIDYQVLLNIYNKKNKFEKKFINLINFLKEYYILFNNNNNNENSPIKNLFVSAFSLKKIMTLGGYIDLDIFDFGKIVVMKNLNTEEIKNRRNKIEKEFNYANIRSIRESILKAEANKNKKFYIGNDIAFKGIKENLNEMELCYENINEILMNEDLRKKYKEEKIKNQESLINTKENNNNLNNYNNNNDISENDKEIILSAKENLLSILNNVENNTLYLYDDNVLISSSFYYQLTNEDLSLTIEDVYLPNYFDNNTLTLIQQSKLKNNKLNNTNEFIVINDGIKTYIVNKQSFLSSLVENEYNNKINVYNLYTKSNEIVDILNVKIIEIPIEDINNYTHADTLNSIENNNNNNNNNSIEKINSKLKNLLKNSLILIEIKNKLIPKKIIDDINNDTTNKKEFEVISVDKDLKPSDHLKLTKEECSNILQYPSYVEITLDQPEIKETKKLFLKKKSLDVGFNNNEFDIITNDNNNNNYTFKKKNIIKISHNNIIDYNQFKVDIQMKDIIFNLNNEIKNGKIYYVIFDNDNNKKLIRKEYFSLIKNYNTVIPFENFNVYDDNNNEVIINKNKIPNNFIEYVEVTNNYYKPGKILYINVNDIKKEHLEMINDDYDFEEFYNEQPVKMKLKDIIIIKNTSPITELPIQKEEERKRDLIEKKNLINEENENRDFIKIYDINDNPQFILKKYLLDSYNKITTYSKNPLLNKKFELRSNFNIRNLYGDVITVNTDEIIDNNNNKENLITYIIIIDKSNGNKKYLVDKEKLKREINKVNNNNNEINIFDNNTDSNVKIKIKDFKLGNLIPEKLPQQNLLQIKESFMLNESDYESDSSSINNDEEKKLKKKNDRKIFKIRKCVIRRFIDDDEEVN